jgi:ferredoxin
MPQITAETATGTVSFDAPAGKKLVLALEDNGVDILHRCGGNARCTTCRVEVLSDNVGERSDDEEAILLTKEGIGDNVVRAPKIRFNIATIPDN